MRIVNLPNLLTLGRLLSVPVTVWLMSQNYLAAAFWLFVAAGITDAIDGAIARFFNARTAIGAYLDPLADKALLVSIYVMLGLLGHLDSWLVIMIVFRDLLIVGGAVLMMFVSDHTEYDPLYVSKLNTFFQIMLAASVLAHLGLGIVPRPVVTGLTYVVAFTTMGSGLAYLVVWGRRLATAEKPPGDDR